jgi:hypothetical protein
MRKLQAVGAVLCCATGMAVAAEEPFDACQAFTQADAQKALGTEVVGEAFNPKVKRPKVVTSCVYTGTKEGKPVEARVQYRFAQNPAELQKAFEESRLQIATKPLMVKGADASFWSARTGQMNLRKGRTWLIVHVGSPKPVEREVDSSRALAEALAARL